MSTLIGYCLDAIGIIYLCHPYLFIDFHIFYHGPFHFANVWQLNMILRNPAAPLNLIINFLIQADIKMSNLT